jgi:hypothetical protein
MPPRGIKSRRYGRNGRGYTVDGIKFPGVTTISSQIKSGGLMAYSGKAVARGAVDNWEDLDGMPPATRLDALYKLADAEKTAAGNRGTEVHRLGAELAAGREVEVPEDLAGYVDAYRAWLDKFEPVILATELIVANRRVRYCGQLDLIADLGPIRPFGTSRVLPAARHLIDVKTSRSGIWPETALQCCGYRNAEVWAVPDDPDNPRPAGEAPEERPIGWLQIEVTSALWLTPDGGYEFRDLYTGPEVWAQFERLAGVWWGGLESETWVGVTAEPA